MQTVLVRCRCCSQHQHARSSRQRFAASPWVPPAPCPAVRATAPKAASSDNWNYRHKELLPWQKKRLEVAFEAGRKQARVCATLTG